MPRHAKPPRLWMRLDDGAWIILDADLPGRQRRTGFAGLGGQRDAEAAFARYLAGKAPKRTGPAQPTEIAIAEVLALYVQAQGAEVESLRRWRSVDALAESDGHCDTVIGASAGPTRSTAQPRLKTWKTATGLGMSRSFTAGPGTVRRELGVLQAAMNAAHAEGRLIYAPQVTLPEGGHARDRWLTRGEAARLLLHAAPHVRRFIVIALASGRRAAAILALRQATSLDSGWIDATAGVLHFQGARQRTTKKRKGSIAMPRSLAAHARRWARRGGSHAIMWKGRPIAEIDTGLARAAERAGLEGVTPHVLKHTAVTWAFQRGISLEDAADWFATSPQTLMKHYRAHSPDYQSRAREIMERR